MTIDSTVKRIDSPGRFEIFAGGGLAAVMIFSVGVLLLVVPIVGWVVGPALMILAGVVAAAHAAGIFRNKPSYVAQCPYCGTFVTAGEAGSVGECGACKEHFVHRGGHLWKMEEQLQAH